MRRGVVGLAVATIGVLLSTAGAADEAVEWTNADGTISVRLPAAWSAQVTPHKTFAFNASVTAPEAEHPFELQVYVLPHGRDPRAQAWIEKPAQASRHRCEEGAVQVSLDPLPYLTMEWGREDAPARAFYSYVVRRRRCFTVVVEQLDASAWPALREPLLAVASSLETTLPQVPEEPEGYTVKVDRGLRFVAHPDVSRKDLGAVRKSVAALRKDFESRHGALRIDSDNPPMVFVNDAPGRARALSARAADATAGQLFDYELSCLFLVPPRDEYAEVLLARETVGFLCFEAHGNGPRWLFEGEGRAAVAHAITDEKLPTIPAEWGPLPTKLPPFDMQLNGVRESLYWVLFFRYGPSKYRKAFDAYLDDLADTGDWDGARKRHLLSLDQEAMQEAADEFVAKKVKLIDTK